VPAPQASGDVAEPGLRFFVDRSLGAHVVPTALREAGWILETMDERYGEKLSQEIRDVQWIEEATELGDVLLCKDLRIAVNPLEADAVYRVSARAFGLARRDIKGPDMVQRFLGNQARIFRMASRAEGPYVVSISENGLRRIRLNLSSPSGAA
jgi:PIN like domain